MELSKKIETLIEKSGKTKYQISKETGIERATLTRLVKGENKDLMLSRAFKLADALGVDVNEFRKD